MSSLFVSKCDDGKFAVIDGRSGGIFSVDFVKMIFDTEDEAQAKLREFEECRERENKAEPFSMEEAQKYAESHAWKFASTYAKTAPHEYLVKSRLAAEDQLLYERFVATMRANFVDGYFYGHKNQYLILGKYYYWYMPLLENCPVDLINRTTTDHLELKDGVYYYKPLKAAEDKDERT